MDKGKPGKYVFSKLETLKLEDGKQVLIKVETFMEPKKANVDAG